MFIKLSQGYGEQAIFVLDRLADEALRSTSFQWNRPTPPVESGLEDDGPMEDEAELNLDRVEEEMAAEYSEEEEDEILHINEITGATAGMPGGVAISQRPEEIMESTTDAEEWRMEV